VTCDALQLCFAECFVLQGVGCVLWDLGGYDLCPIMQCIAPTIRTPIRNLSSNVVREQG
jgi:hypothetical protein